MNYYNPYYLINPGSMVETPRLFSGLFNRGGLTLGTILNGAQRTLGLVNQALPIIKEAAPMMRNAKTMFKVMNEFKKMDTPSKKDNVDNTHQSNVHETNHDKYRVSYGGPTFFI